MATVVAVNADSTKVLPASIERFRVNSVNIQTLASATVYVYQSGARWFNNGVQIPVTQ